MKRNLLREKLQQGAPTLGTRLMSTWPSITEVVGYSRQFDYVEFLAEYAPFTSYDLENVCRAAELHQMSCMLKIPQQSRMELALRGMNAGFQNMLFADVRTVEDAIECVKSVRAETPQSGGLHGVGHGRDSELVLEIGSQNFYQSTMDVVITLMIEKREAIDNLEKILAVEGIDMVQFGPGDYSMSIGHIGERQHPEVKEAEIYMIRTSQKMGVVPRAEIPNPASAEYYMNLGVRHFCMQTETIILHNWYKTNGQEMRNRLLRSE